YHAEDDDGIFMIMDVAWKSADGEMVSRACWTLLGLKDFLELLLRSNLISDSPPPNKNVEGVEHGNISNTTEEKLASKNALKAKRVRDHTLIVENKMIWRIKLGDSFNNLKIYEAEVKGSYSSSQNTQNVAFVSSNSTGSTNETVNTAHGVSAGSSQDHASTLPNVNSMSDAVIYSFFANQVVDGQLLTMRARRFLKKTGRNLGVNGTDTIGFDKTKVECYNFHRRGHFARECRAPKNQDNRNRETPKRTMPIEETTSKALLSQCDGFGYDWSDQVEDGPTNFSLMAYTSLGSSNSSGSDNEINNYEIAFLCYNSLSATCLLGNTATSNQVGFVVFGKLPAIKQI
ncbi:ribonuclease H-like domain-containing protein, partial [Tanacetum coccineum]